MRAILSLVTMLALLWSGCFVWFIHTLPDTPTTARMHTDAIIVLTGGNGRVEHGLELVALGVSPRLFISGVGTHVTLPQLLRAHTTPQLRAQIDALRPEIVLDYIAESTQTNALQAANFAREQHLNTIRLITANYHMPRSLLEFEKAMPGVTIIADPVFPENFHAEQWWQHDATRRLIFSEFRKYFAAFFLRSAA